MMKNFKNSGKKPIKSFPFLLEESRTKTKRKCTRNKYDYS